MTARWFIEADGQRYRVDPDAGLTHPAGCLCPECQEIRVAAGGGRRTDKHIADLMEARERGKIAAEQAITAQRHREAAARAQVTRELAGYGSYPYRVAREAAQEFLDSAARHRESSDCTCRPPAWNPGSPYWAAHDVACPMRARLCRPPGTLPASAAGLRDQDEPAGPPDPVAQWWEVTRSAILPDYGYVVAKIPDQPPGTCRECRTGPPSAGNLCWYCNLLRTTAIREGLAPEPRRRHSRKLLPLLLAACFLGAGLCLVMALVSLGAS